MNARWTKWLLPCKIAHLCMTGLVHVDLACKAGVQPGLAGELFSVFTLTHGGGPMNESTAQHSRQEVGFNSRTIITRNFSIAPAFRRLASLVALMAMVLMSQAAKADAIKLGNLWIENVTVDTFDGNELHYLVNGSPNKQYLSKIDGFKLAAYPQLEDAEKALKAGNAKEVLASLKTVRSRAKEPWLRLWLDARLVPLMDREGEPMGAVNTFISLVESRAAQSFLEDPPIKSARALSKEDKAKVHEKLKSLRKNATDKTPLADTLDELVEATTPGSEPVPVTPGTKVDADVLPTVVPLPMSMLLLKNRPDQITKLIARGQFDTALERVQEELKAAAGGGKTSLLLYQRGVCQYYVALEMDKDASKKEQAQTLYKDAGLSLFRIPTFFRNSPYVGASMIETAAVHIKLNRPDVAKALLEQAAAYIDPVDDKLLYERLEKLREGL